MRLFAEARCALAAAAVAVAIPGANAYGEQIESLQRKLRDAEAENARLRERIDILERGLTPRRVDATPASRSEMPADDEQDVDRALERALVREGGLLLSPRSTELELNFVHSHADSASGIRRDAYGPGLVVRKGLGGRSQLDVALPYVFERRRAGDASSRANGVGDLTVGVSHQFLSDGPDRFALIGSAAYRLSTGRNTIFESTRPVALGSGFDALQLGFTAVKRIDPMVFYGGYTYAHPFADDVGGLRVEPGRSQSIRIGAALAAGPTTSLRATFNVGVVEPARIDGIALSGASTRVASLDLGGSVALGRAAALDIVIGVGLTRAAPGYRIGVALPYRF